MPIGSPRSRRGGCAKPWLSPAGGRPTTGRVLGKRVSPRQPSARPRTCAGSPSPPPRTSGIGGASCVSRKPVAPRSLPPSGPTGEPKRVYYPFRERQALTNFAALALRFRNPGRLVALIVLPTSHGLWVGSASAQRAVERAGGLPLPVGADDPGETLTWME